MTQKLKQTAKNIFAIPKIGTRETQERRASVFGMVESGKTTFLGLLEIVCVDYANKTNKRGSKNKFHFLVQERTSGIRQTSSELRQGMFPPKTTGGIFEADFMMRFGKTFSEKQIRLPFCETAGETFNTMLERFGDGQYELNPNMKDAQLVHDYILNTDAPILIAPVTRPLGLEKEIGAQLNLPDVNLSRLLAAIYGYKMEEQRMNPMYKPIKGIAVFLTKIDGAKTHLAARHINIDTEEGIHLFMSKYFPETYAVLGWYGLENVKFWPIGVELETDVDDLGNPIGKIHPLKPERGYKLKVDHSRNVPVFTEQPFYEFIEWLKDTVMA